MTPEPQCLPTKARYLERPALYAGIVVLLIAVVMIWVWSPIFDAYFYADDFMYLLGAQTPAVLRASLVPRGTDLVWVYRPLPGFGYYWIVRSLFGLNPVAFHLISVTVHLLNAALVAWLVSYFGCSRLASLFASLIYAAHISHFGGLVTVGNFQELLATFLIFSALVAYLRTESLSGNDASRPILALVCFGAALLSKESAFSFPLLLTWLEAVRPAPLSSPSPLWTRFHRLPPFYVMAVAYGMMLSHYDAFPTGPVYALGFNLSALGHLKQYLWWALEPTLWGLPSESNLIFLLFAGLLIMLWRHWQAWLGLGWLLISFLPVMFLLHRMNAQYIMIGLLGLCLVVGIAIDRALAIVTERNPQLAPYVGVAILGCILLSAARARFDNQRELQAGWTGRTQRIAKCVASYALTRFPAGLPAKTVIFRGFDSHVKWILWGGAIMNVLYSDPAIRSRFVPDLRIGPAHALFTWMGNEPERDSQVTIDRQDISSCEFPAVILSPSPPSPQPVRTRIIYTATAAGMTASQYRFWVQPEGGPFTLAQDYSSTNTFAWTPTVAGEYVVCVWARGSASSKAVEADTCMRFLVTPLALSFNHEADFEVFSVGTGRQTTILEVAEVLMKKLVS